MKTKIAFITGLFLLMAVHGNAQNQNHKDFFLGKWEGMTQGAPMGDMKIVISLDRKDGALAGSIKLGEQEEVNFTKTEEKETTVTLNFTSTHGYDVTLAMVKKDENKVEGTIDTSMMGGITYSATRTEAENK
jgi:hypothetical protein